MSLHLPDALCQLVRTSRFGLGELTVTKAYIEHGLDIRATVTACGEIEARWAKALERHRAAQAVKPPKPPSQRAAKRAAILADILA